MCVCCVYVCCSVSVFSCVLIFLCFDTSCYVYFCFQLASFYKTNTLPSSCLKEVSEAELKNFSLAFLKKLCLYAPKNYENSQLKKLKELSLKDLQNMSLGVVKAMNLGNVEEQTLKELQILADVESLPPDQLKLLSLEQLKILMIEKIADMQTWCIEAHNKFKASDAGDSEDWVSIQILVVKVWIVVYDKISV